jgi:hypothetical protein
MARPDNLNFVFANLPSQAQENFPDLPDLPIFPPEHGGGDPPEPPTIDFPQPALDALNDLPEHAHLPDWLLGG